MNPLGRPGMLLSMGVTKSRTLLGDWQQKNKRTEEVSHFLLHMFSLRLLDSQNHKDIRNLMGLLGLIIAFWELYIYISTRSCNLKSWERYVMFTFLQTPWVGFQYFNSVQFSRSIVSDALRPHGLQHTKPPCPSPTPGVHPNPRPSSQWCHATISCSVVPFSSCPQSFPASGFFSNESALRIRWPKYWSFSFSINSSMNTPYWSPLGWTGWISLQSKGLSRHFSNTIVQNPQYFSAQLSL